MRYLMIASLVILTGLFALMFPPSGTGGDPTRPPPDPVIAAAPKDTPDGARLMRQQLQDLDRMLARWLLRLGPPAATATLRRSAAGREAARLRTRLHDLERAIAALDSTSSTALLRKIQSLRVLARNLAHAATRAGNPSPGRRSRRRSPATLAAGTAQRCAQALAVTPGTYVGDTSGTGQGEVWLRYVAQSDGVATVDTLGSDYDTELSVHTACGGAGTREVVASDDAFGLQAMASFATRAGAAREKRKRGQSP